MPNSRAKPCLHCWRFSSLQREPHCENVTAESTGTAATVETANGAEKHSPRGAVVPISRIGPCPRPNFANPPAYLARQLPARRRHVFTPLSATMRALYVCHRWLPFSASVASQAGGPIVSRLGFTYCAKRRGGNPAHQNGI